MPPRKKKSGLPRALESNEEDQEFGSPEEFAKHMFGSSDTPQEGIPSVDWLKEQFKTKSAAVRYLINQGHAVKLIAKHLGMRYQHVRNVATNELKRGPNEDWRKPLLDPQTNQPETETKPVDDPNRNGN